MAAATHTHTVAMPIQPGAAVAKAAKKITAAIAAVPPAVLPTLPSPALEAIARHSIDPPRPATTTFQQDLTTAGQRNVNLIWETTQGNVASRVIIGAMAINGIVLVASVMFGKDLTAAQALALGFVNSLATGVTSFYFSRTNHTQIGGVGDKPHDEYRGR